MRQQEHAPGLRVLSLVRIKQLAGRRFRLQHEVQLITKLLWGGGSVSLDNTEGGSGQQCHTAGGPALREEKGRNNREAHF